jgi:chaperonin GroES
VAVGKGKLGDDGKVTPLDVKINDRILFGKYSALRSISTAKSI